MSQEDINKNMENVNILEKDSRFESERLIFEPSWKADPKALATEADDLEIALAVGENFPIDYTEEDALKFIGHAKESWEKGSEYNFGIFDKANGGYIGNIGFKISPNGKTITNIGYWLGLKSQGQGYATESTKACLEFIKEKFAAVTEVLASSLDYNKGSINVLLKCGFVPTGVVDPEKTLRDGRVAKSVKYKLEIIK